MDQTIGEKLALKRIQIMNELKQQLIKDIETTLENLTESQILKKYLQMTLIKDFFSLSYEEKNDICNQIKDKFGVICSIGYDTLSKKPEICLNLHW